MTIRTDERQWLIYDEETVRAVQGAVEIFLMGLGGTILMAHEEIRMRAIGNVGIRVSETRLQVWEGTLKDTETTELRERLAGYVREIISWLGSQTDEKPEQALDEIHAAIVWLDRRANAAGVVGPGWYRDAIRESQSAG